MGKPFLLSQYPNRKFADVRDFGSVGTGSDDTAVFLAALAGGADVIGIPEGGFNIATQLNTNGVQLEGQGFNTILTATAPMSSLILVKGQNNILSNMKLMGADQADALVNFDASNGSQMRNCWLQDGKRDGVNMIVNGNNNNVVLANSVIRSCGQTYTTGTATAAANATLIPIAGAPNLTTLGLRPLLDYVQFGSGPPLMIVSVAAAQLEVYPGTPVALTAAAIKIMSGNGISAPAHGNNSAISAEFCTIQQSACAAILHKGLYGFRTFANVVEFNSIGYIWGQRGGPSTNRAIGPTSVGDYFESAAGQYDFLIESASQFAVLNPQFGTSGVTDYMDRFRFVDTASRGVIIANGQLFPAVQGAALHSPAFTAEFGQTYVVITNVETVVTLPAIPAAGPAQASRGFMYEPIIIRRGAGTGSVKFITTDARTINGVAGATGVSITGTYKHIVATFGSIGDWTITGA